MFDDLSEPAKLLLGFLGLMAGSAVLALMFASVIRGPVGPANFAK